MAHSVNRVGNAPRFKFQISNTKFPMEQSRHGGVALTNRECECMPLTMPVRSACALTYQNRDLPARIEGRFGAVQVRVNRVGNAPRFKFQISNFKSNNRGPLGTRSNEPMAFACGTTWIAHSPTYQVRNAGERSVDLINSSRVCGAPAKHTSLTFQDYRPPLGQYCWIHAKISWCQ